MSQNGDIGLSSFTEGAKKAETTNEKGKLIYELLSKFGFEFFENLLS